MPIGDTGDLPGLHVVDEPTLLDERCNGHVAGPFLAVQAESKVR